MFETILAVLGVSFAVTYLTNPFVKLSIIRLPYRVKLDALAHKIVNNNHKIKVYRNWVMKLFAYYQCGLYIFSTRYLHQSSSQAPSVRGIINDIHTLRFNSKKLLLISGDHFNGLFVRNLGVFYYPTLDANIHNSEKDWRDRQETYLQTVAYALGVFNKDPHLKTTLVSTGPYSAVGINFYSYPSDTLFGILYGLAALLDKTKSGAELYHVADQQVDTIAAATVLLDEYMLLLKKLYKDYRTYVFNDATGLIKTSVHLSGAKDITKRRSSFYDNVIFWRTTQLAMMLGIIKNDKKFLAGLKQKIIATFWLKHEGYFLEDLSDESQSEKFYSSDWLIVLSTGFLDITKPRERLYYTRSFEYIKKTGVARPFAIKYQAETRAHRQFLAVRLAVASYGGDAIWSFWGMEYIKSALLLYSCTNDQSYLDEADYHIAIYKKKMKETKGFPEVYGPDGSLLQTPFYRSILMTGWVIGFEQVLVMRSYATSGSPTIATGRATGRRTVS